jgi:hypothetical protein
MDSNSSLGFDLNSQKGVAILLASLRASTLSSVQKNEIRDLVFSYTNGGGDASVRIALEQKLKSYNIAPVQTLPTTEPKKVEPPKPAAPVLPFGSSRPVPVFKVAPGPILKNEPVQKPHLSNTPVKNTAPTKPFENKKVDVGNPIPKAASDVPKNPSPDPKPKPVDVPLPEPTPAPVNAAYLDRIREIKSIVNTKVGNPVNLVDIDNQVGREYMSALLEAMKKLSGGIPGQLDLAMKRLEMAFVEVEKAIEVHNKTAKIDIAKPEPAPEKESENFPALANSFAENKPVQNATPLTQAENVKTQPITAIPRVENTTATRPEIPVSDPMKVVENIVASSVVSVPTPPPIRPQPTPAPASNQTQAPEVSGFKARSVLNEDPLAKPTDLPLTKPTENKVEITDPLYANDVSAGLDQLLSEWSIFKKSGLFGTGPKGKEHPLFKKISDLQIPLLLAGRFEGSTQEIRQSITDYMNGWRYEQGIIYENGETFEKYLRRVIKQILDLQKKRIPS